MRYSASHKAETREKLIESSGAIAKQGGFAGASVDALMRAIGLTGGAFYSHFPSKDDLFGAIVERELGHSVARLARAGDDPVEPARKLRECLEHYLSLAHVDCPDSGCALPSLGAEIARADAAVREDAEHWMSQLQSGWARILGDEALAWAFLAQCVGALVVARMLVTPSAREQVLAGSKALLFGQMEGCTEPANRAVTN